MLWWASVHIVMINPAAWAFLKVAYVYDRLAMNHDRPSVLATDVRTICYGPVCIPVISEYHRQFRQDKSRCHLQDMWPAPWLYVLEFPNH